MYSFLYTRKCATFSRNYTFNRVVGTRQRNFVFKCGIFWKQDFSAVVRIRILFEAIAYNHEIRNYKLTTKEKTQA